MDKQDIEIIIIEDEEDILELIEYHLSKEGYRTTGFLDTQNVERFLEEENPKLMIIDRNLPHVEGSEFVKYIRDLGYDIPVIFLTAKINESELEEGFDAGADDYMTKPFSYSELKLRVKALLRRTGALQQQNKLKHKQLTIDLNKKNLYINEVEVSLTKLEFKLLYVFMKYRDKALTRNFLRDEVWGVESAYVNDNVVNVAINRLKNKIDSGNKEGYFQPVWGVGYIFS